MRTSLLFLFFLTIDPYVLNAQDAAAEQPDKVNLSLFEQSRPASMLVRSEMGVDVYGDGKLLLRLSGADLLYIRSLSNGLRLRTIEKPLGCFKEILIKGVGDTVRYTLQVLGGQVVPRTYSGLVRIFSKSGKLQPILTIGMEQYISGVVESEVGAKQVSEMYKVQAIIARTYALSHMGKHDADGFNLCDGVHCQAFKGLTSHSEIIEACTATRDLVVVNSNNEMITAAFHANCGGQTVNSEDIWLTPKSYLRSVICPYCSSSKSYTWIASVPLSKWASYIAEKGVKAASESVPRQFMQPSRLINIKLGSQIIPLKTVRNDLGFRSAFFSFKQVGDSVVFTGRGYGHGVGLCQDGASEMARQNMPFERIISFYYNGCRVVNRREAVVETNADTQEPFLSTKSSGFFDSSTTSQE